MLVDMQEPGERDQPSADSPPDEPREGETAPATIERESAIPCLSCGFDLRGLRLGERCPECGTAINAIAPPAGQRSGPAVASMVLGICSLVACMFYGVIGLPCGIIAMVYARKARVLAQTGEAPMSSLGMAKAGRVCGLIGIILNSLMLALVLAYFVFIIVVINA